MQNISFYHRENAVWKRIMFWRVPLTDPTGSVCVTASEVATDPMRMLSRGEGIKGMGYLTFWWLSHLRLSWAICLGNLKVMLLSLFYFFALNSVFLKINQAFISQTLYFCGITCFCLGENSVWKNLFLVPILTSLSLSLSLSHSLTLCMFTFPTPVFRFSLIFFSLLCLACWFVSPSFLALFPPCRTRWWKAASAQSSRSGGEGGSVLLGMDIKASTGELGRISSFHLLPSVAPYIQCLPHFCEKSRCFCVHSENL